jgi:Lrp/AsnC family transcriptional regulator for asnA, asnC and gidA
MKILARTESAGEEPRHPMRFHDERSLVDPLSELDKDILTILQQDGRRSAQSIAEELGVPQRRVRAALSDILDRRGIRVTAVTVPALLGYEAMAFAEFSSDGTVPRREVASSLASLECIDYVVTTAGPSDVMANLVCRDFEELRRVVEEQVCQVPGVRLKEVTPYLALHYQKTNRAVPASRYAATFAPATRLDDLDRRLIQLFSKNGRSSFTSIADTLGVSESYVRARLRRLTESGVLRLAAIVDARLLGYESMLWARASVSGAAISDVVDDLAGIAAVTYIAETMGSFDVMFEITCIDDSEVRETFDQVRRLPHLSNVVWHRYFDAIFKPMIPQSLEC